MIVVQACDLAFASLSAKSLYCSPLMFLNVLAPLFACFYLLVFYNPARKKKQRVIEGLN